MHTLSIFPSLLTFALLSPFITRVMAALFVLYLGKKRYNKEYKWISFIYIVSGALVFIGLWTQVAAIVAIAVLKWDFYVDFYRNRNVTLPAKETYFLYALAIFILLSLLFTGPGFFAFDLPL